jgi:hypothetical protein
VASLGDFVMLDLLEAGSFSFSSGLYAGEEAEPIEEEG